jgi:hypothetical protein
MNNFLSQMMGGSMASMPMGMMFGPMGAIFGFGAGMFGASQGMQGNVAQGALGGAAMGGLCGMVMGNPLGGALAGGASAGLIALLFSNFSQQQSQQSQQSQYAPYYPQQQQYGYGNNTSMLGLPSYDFNSYVPNYGQGQGSYSQAYAGNGYASAVAGQYYPQQQQYQQPPNYGGTLKQEGEGKPISYTTSGGYKVNIDGGKITVTDPQGKNEVVQSGDPHEYVNGERVKDWDGKTRSLVLSDGTKITMNATGPQGTIENYSIYDGAESVRVKANGNKIDEVSFNPQRRQWLDANQSDGETAYIGYNQRGQFTYTDIYKQNENLGVTPYYKDLARVDNHWWNNKETNINPSEPNFDWGYRAKQMTEQAQAQPPADNYTV